MIHRVGYIFRVWLTCSECRLCLSVSSSLPALLSTGSPASHFSVIDRRNFACRWITTFKTLSDKIKITCALRQLSPLGLASTEHAIQEPDTDAHVRELTRAFTELHNRRLGVVEQSGGLRDLGGQQQVGPHLVSTQQPGTLEETLRSRKKTCLQDREAGLHHKMAAIPVCPGDVADDQHTAART